MASATSIPVVRVRNTLEGVLARSWTREISSTASCRARAVPWVLFLNIHGDDQDRLWHLLDHLVEMRDSAGETPPSRRRQTGNTARQLPTNP